MGLIGGLGVDKFQFEQGRREDMQRIATNVGQFEIDVVHKADAWQRIGAGSDYVGTRRVGAHRGIVGTAASGDVGAGAGTIRRRER